MRAAGSEPARVQLMKMASLYSREHLLYPPTFWRQVRLKTIMLCSKLSYDEQTR